MITTINHRETEVTQSYTEGLRFEVKQEDIG